MNKDLLIMVRKSFVFWLKKSTPADLGFYKKTLINVLMNR